MVLDSHENNITDALGLQQALTSLDVGERQVINSLYFLDRTHDEVAVAFGMRRQWVERVEREALAKLRATFNND